MGDRITVRMTADMIERIDAWIATQPGYVSRQEAVRRFVDAALIVLSGPPEGRIHGGGHRIQQERRRILFDQVLHPNVEPKFRTHAESCASAQNPDRLR